MVCPIHAFRRRDTAMIRNVCLNGGYKSKHSNEEVMMKLMRFGFDTYGKVCGWLEQNRVLIVRGHPSRSLSAPQNTHTHTHTHTDREMKCSPPL